MTYLQHYPFYFYTSYSPMNGTMNGPLHSYVMLNKILSFEFCHLCLSRMSVTHVCQPCLSSCLLSILISTCMSCHLCLTVTHALTLHDSTCSIILNEMKIDESKYATPTSRHDGDIPLPYLVTLWVFFCDKTVSQSSKLKDVRIQYCRGYLQ